MAILYRSNNNLGALNAPTDPPVEKPMSERKTYSIYATKKAPFLSNWINNPITRGKMDEQFKPGVADKMLTNIDKLHLFDMRKLGSMSGTQFSDLKTRYNSKRKLNPHSAKAGINKRSMDRMRLYGQKYNPATGTGVQGVRIPSFGGIGTIYDIDNVDEFGTATHELTHATKYQDLAEKHISDKWGSKQRSMGDLQGLGFDESEKQLNYLRSIGVDEKGVGGEGVYPRIMQLRKVLNLSPGQKVTPETFKDIKFEDKKSPLRGLRANWDDATIIDIMNTVAKNKTTTDPYTITA